MKHEVSQVPCPQELTQVIEHIDCNLPPVEDVSQESTSAEKVLQITQDSTPTPSVGEDSHVSTTPITTCEVLECNDLDFLGVEAFLERSQQYMLHKVTKIHLGVMVLPTFQVWTKDHISCPKISMHKSIMASTMALALLAIHGVLTNMLGDLFSLFFYWSYIFFFVSYILFALKWKDPP